MPQPSDDRPGDFRPAGGAAHALPGPGRRSVHIPGQAHGAVPIPAGARVGPLLMSSGIAGKDPATHALPAEAAAQVPLVFANLRAFLAAGGARLDDVAHVRVLLGDDSLRAAVNQAWVACFPDPDDRPARHTVVHPLPYGMAVQLEVTAYVQDAPRARQDASA